MKPMRTVSFLLAFVLAGCDLGGRVAKGDDQPAAPKESYTAAVARFESTVAGLAETQGNTNSELEGIKEELKALKKQVADLNLLLTVDAEISVPVPKAIDAPPVEKAEQKVAGPTLHGKPLNVAATIKANYRRMWSFPGSIDSHLAEHGVKGTEGLDYETKRQLHSALHEMGQAPAKVVVKERVIAKAPIVLPQQSSCPNGRCPNMQYGYSNRSRLFGFRR
jgi:hypothetical protein